MKNIFFYNFTTQFDYSIIEMRTTKYFCSTLIEIWFDFGYEIESQMPNCLGEVFKKTNYFLTYNNLMLRLVMLYEKVIYDFENFR